MHLIVVKRERLDEHPWLARSITKAFSEALEYGYAALKEMGAFRYMLPWLMVSRVILCYDSKRLLTMPAALHQSHVDETKR